jgi:hypothetical protein
MIRIISCALIGMLLGYLVQSFYFVSFDIGKWNEEGRFFALLFMIVGGFWGGLLGFAFKDIG